MTPGPPVELGIEGIADATRIGEGASGTVYRAKEGVLERTVAVKVLRSESLDDQACRALAGVSAHPHVAGLYSWGRTASGQPFLVQEYLAGGTLAERVADFGPLPWEEAAEIGVKLAGALAAAHGAGVLHGDVRPENILISSFDEPKLADFSLGTATAGATSLHTAPEVLSGRPATEASDVYSLASTLYALAAGHAPFATPDDVLRKAPPDLRAQGVPGPLWEALAAALAKDPLARTSSARAFGDALRSAQRAGGQTATRMVVPDPVIIAPARRPEAPPRRSRSALIGALVLAIVALLAAGALAATQVGDDEDDREQVALEASTTTAVPTTPAPASTAPPTTSPTPTTAAATTRPPATTTTRPASGPATTAGPGPSTSAPAGGIAACNPSFFRATISSDRPTYNNGDTVTVSARFENTSGRPCSYPQTGASSQLLNPFGEAMGPIRTLVGDNVDNVPFEPGTSQTFRSMWEVNTCVNPTTCYPGRYTITMNVVPFGGGQVSFDVT